MYEKANLRKILTSWRGKAFTEEEARAFDITKLLGATCMLNIVHKPGTKDPTKVYEEIASVSTLPKGLTCPPAVNKILRLEYDKWDQGVYDSLPDFIKKKIQVSEEYKSMMNPKPNDFIEDSWNANPVDDLPF
jgi:glutamate mutase epsilon subunit